MNANSLAAYRAQTNRDTIGPQTFACAKCKGHKLVAGRKRIADTRNSWQCAACAVTP